ncbi:MAG TPA: hypothetical protein VHU86_00250 [Solirubrobacterales bacterium]|jgi:hypothetical protein|nr:hypothetical protein [Solirubrobacterales bacterium]
MGTRTSKLSATASLLAVAALFAVLCSLAGAEVAAKDGVRVSVAGKLSPTRLPRSGAVPVSVSVAGHITATKPGALPKLEAISIAINSHGRVNNRGIPLCRLGHIEPSTSAEALAACRSSLIGEGHFSANVKLPEESPFPSAGKVLAFNGKLSGKPAIFAHIYGTKPVPTSYVLPFLITKTHGTYGAVLQASLPKVTGEWGYVTGVSLDLQSRFLSAGCPAPAGFPGIAFPLMRTTFGFAEGLKLESILNRSCKVR